MPDTLTPAGKGKTSIFRPAALEQLSVRESVDTPLRVTTLRTWVPLVCLGILVLVGLLWSVFGRIPMAVTGRGVLIRPGKVVNLQAPAAGQLQALYVREGDWVEKGKVVAALDQASLRQQLEQEQAKLLKVRTEYDAIASLQQMRSTLEKSIIELRSQDLTKRVKETQGLADRIRETNVESVKQQRQNIARAIELGREISRIQKDRLEQLQKLRAKSAVGSEELMQAEQNYLQALSREVELQGQQQQLDLRNEQVQDTYLDKMDKVSQLRSQLSELHLQDKKLEQQNLELLTTQKLALLEVQRSIDRLELSLEKQGKITSEHTGRVLELTVGAGQVLTPGLKICTIVEEDQSSPLVCLTYFTGKEGKQILAGMNARIALDSVQRERYGCVIGAVRSVSPFPVSKEAAVNTIGNSELARVLMDKDRQIEVFLEPIPQADTASGYAWTSSKGPNLKLTAGSTATVQVTVESRAPITFVLPFLRQWMGD
jgi:HlyD family secretion protein